MGANYGMWLKPGMKKNPTVLGADDKLLTGKQVADHLINSFEAVSNLSIPEDREREREREMFLTNRNNLGVMTLRKMSR